MAKKTSEYPIAPLDFEADWGNNRQDHLPQSGTQVNEFINDSFRDVARACWFDPSSYRLLFFRSYEDKMSYIENPSGSAELVVYSEELSFTGTVKRATVVNHTGTTTINATTNMTDVPLEFGYKLEEKSVTESEWHTLEESATLIVYVNQGSGYVEVARYEGVEHSDDPIELNIRQYLADGSNKVKVTAIADDDEHTTGNLVYNVMLAEMYVENIAGKSYWYRAIVEGMSPNLYQLGEFRIVGTLSKTLHVDVYDVNDYSEPLLEMEKVLGGTDLSGLAYSYNQQQGLDLSSLETGTYVAKVYLTSGTLSTKANAIEYPFMYVRQGDATTAQLVTVANVAPVIYNYESNILCEFAAYNKGMSSASPMRSVQQYIGTVPYGDALEFDSAIDTDTPYQLECPIDIQNESTVPGYLTTEFSISLGDCEVTGGNTVDNATAFAPVAGYDFSMNPSFRSNGEAHPEYVSNDVDGSECTTVQWTKMAFVDDIDGWTHDGRGRTCLRIPAGSRMELPFSFFKFFNNSNLGRNTIELCYRVDNVSDYDSAVITIAANADTTGFTGLKITPDRILAHSSTDTTSDNDNNRGTRLAEGQTVHFMLSVEPNYVQGKNLVTGYLDGCKNFQFEYSGNFNFNVPLVIGADGADVYLYAIRHYATSLRMTAAEKNFISTLLGREAKGKASDRINSVMNSSHDITIDKVRENGYNYFIVEMKNGRSIPSHKNGWSKDSQALSTLEMHYGKHPSWDWRVEDVETGGQGTTSMDYWLWNLRWRLDKWPDGMPVPAAYQDSEGKYNKKRPVSYSDGQGGWTEPSDSKVLCFDGGSVETELKHPKLKRITAKINFASSMQSHKMGATMAYDLLHTAVDGGALLNEAQVAAREAGNPMPSVAVYQYPAFGFSKVGDSYTFIGLFTIGPDKGDKPTFGYDNADYEDELLTLEGTDHTPRLALFNHPWDDNVEYRASNECLNIVNGTDVITTEKGWEVSNAGPYDTAKAEEQGDVDEMLRSEWKPAYDSAYDNSTLIFPIALDDEDWGGSTAAEVLANVNADIATFRIAHSGGSRFANNDMEFWIEGEYVLYHYSPVSGAYVAGVTLSTKYGEPEGDTIDEQNEWFKTKRREAFKEVAADYWDLDDCIFCLCFLIIKGATDNFAKNSYPYKFRSLANGGRWRWRQDDLDTIFDIDNNGGQTKPYYIEFADTSASGDVWFAGSASIFWNLLYECYFEDYQLDGVTKKGIRSMGAAMLTAMMTLTGKENIYDGIIAFYETYFWDKAQKYFPESAYNGDAEIKYEDSWINGYSGGGVDPLRQSLGSHYSAERRWVMYRAIYVMSLFRVGPFTAYTDVALGSIVLRPTTRAGVESLGSLKLTPAIWLYPSVLTGDGGVYGGNVRVEAGGNIEIVNLPTGGQTRTYIPAADWLLDIGDLSKLILGEQEGGRLEIEAARLRTLKIGDADPSEVTTNVTNLVLDTPSLEELDARNAPLSGALDLNTAQRVTEVLAEGTRLSAVLLMTGSKIETLHLPATVTELKLLKTRFLDDLAVASWSGIVTLEMEECNAINTIEALAEAYNATGSSLEYIGIKWNGIEDIAVTVISMLANIAAGKTATGESRVYDATIEGQMKLEHPHYAADFEALQFEEVFPSTMTGFKEGLTTIFNKPLRLFYKDGDAFIYIPFADAEVKRVLMEASIGDGTGITYAIAAARTSIPTFSDNTVIEYFDEFGHFGVTEIAPNSFNGCSKLKRINLNNIETISDNAFLNCSSLEGALVLPSLVTINDYISGVNPHTSGFGGCTKITSFTANNCTKIGGNLYHGGNHGGCFEGCTALQEVHLASVTSIGYNTFDGCTALTTVNAPNITSVPPNAFANCSKLKNVDFWGSITSISVNAFLNCSSLEGALVLPSLVTINDYNSGSGRPTSGFGGCTKITSFTANNCTKIGENLYHGGNHGGCFEGCTALQEVHLASVTSIGGYTFDGCTDLIKVVINNSVPPTINSNTFRGCPTTAIFYVPDDSVDAYKEASGWSEYATRIKPISDLPTE